MLQGMAASVRLHGMAYGGAAVGRLDDGAAIFVPGGLSSELVDVDVTERRKNFARGRLVRVLEPSNARIEPPCPHFLEGCGGCQWQHAAYDAQVAYKQAILADQLRRGAGIAEPPILEPVPSPNAFEYRNTAELHLSGGQIGFHKEGTHELVDVQRCPLVEPAIEAGIGVLRKMLPKLQDVSSIHLRSGPDALQAAFLSDQD